MTITIDSIWVLCGLGAVAGIGLGFGGYIGLCGAIVWRKASVWMGAKLGDFILYVLKVLKQRRGKNSND